MKLESFEGVVEAVSCGSLDSKETIRRVLKAAIEAAKESKAEQLLRVSLCYPRETLYAAKSWYEIPAARALLRQSKIAFIVTPEGQLFRYVLPNPTPAYDIRHDKFMENLDAAKPLPSKSPDKVDVWMKKAATPVVPVELWWQKADRLEAERREDIAAMHREIRSLLGM